MRNNDFVKDYARRNKVPLWQIGDALGKSENTVSRMLRHELTEEKQAQMISIIDGIAEKNKEVIRNG